jgi:hypothetical protein
MLLTLTAPGEATIIVSDVVVEVETRLNHIAVTVAALGDEDVAVLKLNVLGAKVEVDHCCGL